MNCRRTQRLLSLFVGDDLEPRRAAAVRGHLRDCFACSRLYASHREARSALERGGSLPAPPADLWSRIEGALTGARRAPRSSRLSRIAPRIGVAAALLVVLGLGGRRVLDGPGPGESAVRNRTAGARPVPADHPSGPEEYEGSLWRVERGSPVFFKLPVGAREILPEPNAFGFPLWPVDGAGVPTAVRPAATAPARRDF